MAQNNSNVKKTLIIVLASLAALLLVMYLLTLALPKIFSSISGENTEEGTADFDFFTPDFDENIYKNSLEKEIAQEIRSLGHEVQAGVEIASLSADLVVDNKLIIEVDGVEDNQKTRMTNMKKQAILERCGFTVKRITYREWHYSKSACLDRILVG